MSKYQKYVNAVFLAAGALVWLVAQHYIQVLLGVLQAKTAIAPTVRDVVAHGLPIALGAATFVLLRNNLKALNFTTDSVGELTKMTWPSPKETQMGTIVVIVAVLLAAVFFYAVDYAFMHVVKAFIGA